MLFLGIQILRRRDNRRQAAPEIADQLPDGAHLARAEHLIHRIGEAAALFHIHMVQPLANRLVHAVARSRRVLKVYKILPVQLPRVGIVLPQTVRVAVDDAIIVPVLQQHADDAGLGNERLQLLFNAPVARRFQRRKVVPRAVVVEHVQDALLYILPNKRRGIHRQIATLGMPGKNIFSSSQ